MSVHQWLLIFCNGDRGVISSSIRFARLSCDETYNTFLLPNVTRGGRKSLRVSWTILGPDRYSQTIQFSSTGTTISLVESMMYIIGTMRSTDQRRNTTTSKTDMNLSFDNPSCPTVEGICHSSVHPIKKSATVASAVSRTNMIHRLLLWIFFTFCFIGYSLGENTVPLNLALTKGAKVRLNCSSEVNQKRTWKHFNFLERKTLDLYSEQNKTNEIYGHLYSVDTFEKGQFNLLFDAIDNTSGRYMCRPNESIELSAQVIVIDAQPTCSKEVKSGCVKVICSIGFSGDWPPTIEWRNMSGVVETNDTVVDRKNRVTSLLFLSLNHIDRGTSHTLTCTSKFVEKDKPTGTTALNIPEYATNCTLEMGESETSKQSTSSLTSPPPPLYIMGLVFVFAYILPH